MTDTTTKSSKSIADTYESLLRQTEDASPACTCGQAWGAVIPPPPCPVCSPPPRCRCRCDCCGCCCRRAPRYLYRSPRHYPYFTTPTTIWC